MRSTLEHDRGLRELAAVIAEFESEHGELTNVEIEKAARTARSRAVTVRGSWAAEPGSGGAKPVRLGAEWDSQYKSGGTRGATMKAVRVRFIDLAACLPNARALSGGREAPVRLQRLVSRRGRPATAVPR